MYRTDELVRALSVRDLSDPAQGPHAMQLLIADLKAALDNPREVRHHPLVPVEHNYEHLGPTDLGIVRFRRLMLEGARNLGAGLEPAAAKDGAAYTVRSGSAVADGAIPFSEVMTARFGDPLGRVGRMALHAAAPS